MKRPLVVLLRLAGIANFTASFEVTALVLHSTVSLFVLNPSAARILERRIWMLAVVLTSVLKRPL